MTDSRVALGADRLPWLPDEPARTRKGRGDFIGWTVAALMLVAGASYWIGSQSRGDDGQAGISERAGPTAVMPLPEATPTAPVQNLRVEPAPSQVQRDIRVEPAPETAPVPQLASPKPRAEKPVRKLVVRSEPERPVARRTRAKPPATRPAIPAAKAPVTAAARPLALWPARQSAGAYGRVVRIGAFGSRYQAKRGWWAMVRAYPALRRLPAVVVEARNSRGRAFYRFQIGTTSQAHSEVLCQRMQKIRYSCAVVGLAGSRKAVER
jgi:hypothetical protein